ncbi:unnamed protein product [Hyaloperonospora brassicae]|uniref:Uncharacterized protein n=1 Tax=Hyaloperonospora brassicae TaxID=162125 RepID=A0AAV0T3Z4_HYABA|nr:unnamed protein product [Hyaloperonospora brassicae]
MTWRGRTTIAALSLLLLLLRHAAATQESQHSVVVQPTAATSRFAYVTVHYEDTSRDAEYVLGVQVMMHSIKLTGSPYDLVVLTSDSVSEASKALFRSMGCRVLDVPNIKNPFVGNTLHNPNFIYTLNKLHVWNMLEYERVVYLDADNVLVRNADELFLCGDFCAVFMNPCHFHTGLLVVTPSAAEYQRLLKALDYLESFDGADQGFLSSMYSEMLRKAELFTPGKASLAGAKLDGRKKAQVHPKGMRLPVGYNINHKYFYEQYHWKLFYLRQFASMTSPISPIKPWYWWAGFVMDLHEVWHDIRATLPRSQERYGAEEAVKTLLGFFSSLALLTAALYTLKITLPMRQIQKRCAVLTMRNNKQARYAYMAFRMALVVLAFRIAPARVHPLAPVHYGYSLMIFMNVSLHIYFASVISNFWDPHQRVSIPPVLYVTRFWLYVAITAAFELTVVWLSSWDVYMNVVWRLFSIVLSIFLCTYWQVKYYRLVLDAEFGGRKERLRSL